MAPESVEVQQSQAEKAEGKDATDEVEEDSDGADDVMYDETQIDVGPKPPQTCGPRQRWCAVCEECWPIDLHCNPYCQQ